MNISNMRQCVNCGACLQICPNGAISTAEDGLFYRPAVDASKCIDCGRCTAVCPVKEGGKTRQALPRSAFAGTHVDGGIVRRSSSGGAFSAMAEQILRQDGIVFGAVFSDDFQTVRIEGTNRRPLDDLRRSKYVESLTGDSFSNVRKALAEGKKVLYCGTPCQIAGLSAYLEIEGCPAPEDLILCDFLCGGVPSHRIFREYLDGLSRHEKRQIRSVNFRPKLYGWSEYSVLVEFSSGRPYHRYAGRDPYLSAFLYGRCSVRESCLHCPFSDCRSADLTIGDFWSWRSVPGLAENDDGISLIAVNTDRGERFLNGLRDKLRLQEVPVESVASLFGPKPFSEREAEKRAAFLQTCQAKGLQAASERFCMYHGLHRVKKVLKLKLKRLRRSGSRR